MDEFEVDGAVQALGFVLGEVIRALPEPTRTKLIATTRQRTTTLRDSALPLSVQEGYFRGWDEAVDLVLPRG